MSQVYCTSCGTKAESIHRFCANCGNAIVSQPAEQIEASPAGQVEASKIVVTIESLNGPQLRTNALLTYDSQARTLELADDSLTVAPITVNFVEDTSARLARCGKRSAELRFRARAVNSTSDLLIDFPDETLTMSVINAMSRKRVRESDQTASGSGVHPPGRVRENDQARASSGVRPFGGFLLVAGVFVVAYFFFVFSTSVNVPAVTLGGQSFGGGEVNNIGLLNERMIGIVIGIGACLIGTLLWLFGGPKEKGAA